MTIVVHMWSPPVNITIVTMSATFDVISCRIMLLSIFPVNLNVRHISVGGNK